MRAPDARTPGASRANADQERADTGIIGRDAEERKPRAHLATLLAFRGYALHELAGGSFLICRWDRSAHCSDLQAARAFYERLGGTE